MNDKHDRDSANRRAPGTPDRAWWVRILRAVLLAALALPLALAHAASDVESRATALQQHYAQLRPRFDQTQFGRPLQLESMDQARHVQGDIHARLDYRFDLLREALARPESWCEVLILHLNTKYCRAANEGGGPQVVMKVGRKEFQSLGAAHTMRFAFRPEASTPAYFETRLDAPSGPLSTRNYQIVLSAVPVGPSQTFIHLRYSYSYGGLGSFAMNSYLGTAGRNKVGFTILGKGEDGEPEWVKGFRGVVERNAMRYYLAIDAYLASLALPEADRQEKRLQAWFDGTEQYARQLHELERDDYLQVKHREIERQARTAPEALD